MTGFSPTPDQAEAIANRGGALLVSAAAGSGKTRVLTERLMSHLTDGSEQRGIDGFLIITFSRDAAAELRGRISTELSERVAAEPSSRWLRRQNALVQRAHIGTIHSFCADLLREKCHLLGLAPDFAIADDDRAEELKRLALQEVMDAAYEDPTEDFLSLADTVGAGRDDKRLAELVLELHAKLQSHARPDDWARRQIEALSAPGADAGDTPWGAELLTGAADEALYWAGEMDAVLCEMGTEGYEYILKAYGPSIAETAGALREFARAAGQGWDSAREKLPIPFPRLGSLRNPPDAEFIEIVKARRDACKAAAKKYDAAFAEPSEKLMGDMARTAPAMRELLRLEMRFDARFGAEKRRRSLVDYGDLEHLAAQLLTDEAGEPTETAREIAARFTEVMVDEYQDVSAVQDLIVRAVSRGGENLFLVGDVKQSIYRFRLADPTIFIGKYTTFKDAADAGPGEPRRVLLRENFRSRAEVLEGVNAVFRNIMSPRLGELDYAGAELRPGAAYSGAGTIPEILALAIPGAEEEGERPDKLAAEAAFVAGRILELVNGGATVEEAGVARPVGFGDVAVLLRSANVAGGVYRREFAKFGIQVLSEQSGGFFRSSEVTVLVSLLSVIDNPHQDVPLIAVLRSPLFGFTASELSLIRAEGRGGDFYDALLLRAESDAKCRDFVETLARFRRLAPDMALGDFIQEIYSALDCMALVSASAGGAEKRRNLTALFELACRFEQSGYKGLRRFILRLRSMDQRGQEPPAGGGESGGAVRIMSVHRSKGLEFPVVFICDTARRFNKSDARASVLVHPALGLGPKLTDKARGIEYPTLARRAISRRLELEALSEEVRLLYVAMTRARERLYITCSLPDPEKTIAGIKPGLTAPVAPQKLLDMSSPCHWLLAAALADGERHIKISVQHPEASGREAAEAEPSPAPAQAVAADLSDALGWVYPHAASALPSKISATELKSLPEPDGESGSLLPRAARTFRSPRLGANVSLSAADRGTATHLALRFIDFAKTGEIGLIKDEIARLCALGHLSRQEAGAVDAAAILRLFQSPIGARMLASPRVLREFPFTILRPASEFFPQGGGDEVLLQGVVDCCFEEEGELCIVDYKTDRVDAAGVPARAEAYAGQLEAYAMALSRIFGKQVRERALYFLRPSVSYKLPERKK